MKPIPHIIKEVVEAVQKKYDVQIAPAVSEKPFYLHGHPIEVVNILSEKDKHSQLKFKKYPLIVLMQDFDERISDGMRSVSLNVVICTDTKQTFYAAERYQNTFESVLYPLFELFIDELLNSRYIAINKSNLSYTKTDRLYWGRNGLQGNTANLFNDHIDAIEISNLNVTFENLCT